MKCIDWQQIVSPSQIRCKQIILWLDWDQIQAIKTTDELVECIDGIIAQMSKMTICFYFASHYISTAGIQNIHSPLKQQNIRNLV